jgi:hypothetical protein
MSTKVDTHDDHSGHDHRMLNLRLLSGDDHDDHDDHSGHDHDNMKKEVKEEAHDDHSGHDHGKGEHKEEKKVTEKDPHAGHKDEEHVFPLPFLFFFLGFFLMLFLDQVVFWTAAHDP